MNLTEQLLQNVGRQLEAWPMAAGNYRKLAGVRRKHLRFGDVPLSLQFNPARIISTAARTDAKSISQRPCFLCAANRPEEQFSLERLGDEYEVLLNPFPIFNPHFTIAATAHRHQDDTDFFAMARFAMEHPGLTAFYNGSRSGASAPDHLHFQAALTADIPLCAYLEQAPGKLLSLDHGSRFCLADQLAALALHIIAPEYQLIHLRWLNTLLPVSTDSMTPDRSMRNLFMWTDAAGRFHIVQFPRSAHRPACYYAEGDAQRLVSPGAVDMSGMLILPRECDFEGIDSFEAARLLAEVGFDITTLPALRTLLLS